MNLKLHFMGGPHDGLSKEVHKVKPIHVQEGVRYEVAFTSCGSILVNSRGEILLFVVCCAEHDRSCGAEDVCCDRCLYVRPPFE